MLLYYITDRRQFPGPPAEQRRALLAKIVQAAAAGVDYIQLREKDLTPRELEALAGEAVTVLRKLKSADRSLETQLLVNSRADVALAAGAAGVHLPAGELSASEVRALWDAATRGSQPATRNAVIGVSCHTAEEVRAAGSHGADFIVFGPVFEKAGEFADGLAGLRAVCSHPGKVRRTEGAEGAGMAILALGGVTLANAADCLRAGAAGLAGIRLFQQADDLAALVRRLRALEKTGPTGPFRAT